MISQYFNKDNLHHAYLIEGEKEHILPEILNFFETLNIKTTNNPDFCQIEIDNFKINEATNLRSMSFQKNFISEKRIFLICANTFSEDAQGSLLKIFEEPIPNTHFFLIVPEADILARTLFSRFYFIKLKPKFEIETKEVEKFLAMPLFARLDFLKELLKSQENETEEETENGETEKLPENSPRARALKFLNVLELILHKKNSEARPSTLGLASPNVFEQIFNAREFIRQPGSAVKSLMESIALVVPKF